MIKASGAQIITHILKLEGITTVAGIPGGSILPLYNELNKSQIKHVLVRHEQSAGFVAQGMARSTGKCAVCFATSGPGAMNLLTSIADARADSVPVVAITGQVSTSLIGTDAFQEVDTFGLSFPITKYSVMVKDALELLTVLPEAFNIAVSGRPGPVLIDVPVDVQNQVVKFDEWPDIKELHQIKKSDFARRFCSPVSELKSTLPAISKMLLSNSKSVLYIGGGCNSPEGAKAVKEFLSVYNCPVVHSMMAIGVVPKECPNNFGMVGIHGKEEANNLLNQAQLIFACGVRFDERALGRIKFDKNKKLIHLDLDAAEVNKIIESTLSCVGEVESLLPAITEKIREDILKHTEGISEYHNYFILKNGLKKNEGLIYSKVPMFLKKTNFIKPQKFINQFFGKSNDYIFTTDVGQHQLWATNYCNVESTRKFLTSGSLGTMGFGLPAAIGASIANPSKKIICLSGDGSIMMNIQELALLNELNLNVTVIVFKNGTLGLVKQQQDQFFKKNHSASIFESDVNLEQIAKGFGLDSFTLNDIPQEMWEEKINQKGPHFAVVNIHQDEEVQTWN